MKNLREFCKSLAYGRPFDYFITVVILVNSFLIGVQTTYENPTVDLIQQFILYIFTFEVVIRMIAAGNLKEFFKGGWNIFDFVLVVIGWIPPTVIDNASTIMALRVLRVFRVLRLLRTLEEIKLIIAVLIRSMKSLLYNGILFLIFMYLFAVAGVSMFRLPNPDTLSGEKLELYEKLMTEAPHSPANSPDPYGTIGEAFFTLFRALTGEDWTDLRYNLVTAAQYNLISVSPTVVTCFHVIWFCIAAFLLLNLVTGAVINNYQVSIDEEEHKRKKKSTSDSLEDQPA
ncbi:MAG: ion transporter [Muribaculaceae bacterium]|nr:ion transporter [Muribaculaceae bacterium]